MNVSTEDEIMITILKMTENSSLIIHHSSFTLQGSNHHLQKLQIQMISWDDFEKIDIRVGTILEAKVFEKARKPAYQLLIDFGEELGIKKSSAQITTLYEPPALIGRQVIAVVNFPPKQIANFISECLVLGVYNSKGDVVLLHPDLPVNNGDKIG
jgi:tRNA-binding protein